MRSIIVRISLLLPPTLQYQDSFQLRHMLVLSVMSTLLDPLSERRIARYVIVVVGVVVVETLYALSPIIVRRLTLHESGLSLLLKTTRHLAEFNMIEPEMAFADLTADMANAEAFVKSVVEYVLENCKEDLTFFSKFYEKTLMERLNTVSLRTGV